MDSMLEALKRRRKGLQLNITIGPEQLNEDESAPGVKRAYDEAPPPVSEEGEEEMAEEMPEGMEGDEDEMVLQSGMEPQDEEAQIREALSKSKGGLAAKALKMKK